MKKYHIALLIISIALLAILFPYLTDSRKSIFKENIGDMTLVGYDTGEVASKQISGIYGLKGIPLANAYSAVYAGKNGTMRIWVAEAPDHNSASDAFNAMNSVLGGSTGHEGHDYSGDVGQTESHKGHEDQGSNFSVPSKVDIIDIVKPEVFSIQADARYNYYFLKMDYRMGRVYWVSFDHPDAAYQRAMVKQAILNI